MLACLNNAYYHWICRHILEKTECCRILNVSDAVHSIRYCLSYCTFIETETYSEHCQTFKMEHSAKRCTGAEPEFFKDRGVRCLWNSGTSMKEAPQGLVDTLETKFSMENIISLNIPKYPWKYLNKLFWLSKDMNVHDHLTCSTDFWRYLGF